MKNVVLAVLAGLAMFSVALLVVKALSFVWAHFFYEGQLQGELFVFGIPLCFLAGGVVGHLAYDELT